MMSTFVKFVKNIMAKIMGVVSVVLTQTALNVLRIIKHVKCVNRILENIMMDVSHVIQIA